MPEARIVGEQVPEIERVLTRDALDFLGRLATEFEPRRQEVLAARHARTASGERPHFLAETANVRESEWQVAKARPDLDDRRVEITGPAEAKMTINALNSGAKVFMADFEDALSPTWANVVGGQAAMQEAVRRTLQFRSPEGKEYRLADTPATLVVRPRGWHLPERHVEVEGRAISGSLFDFGLYLLHNGGELLQRGSGPYFYLPKLQSHLEARLWNDVFLWAQDVVGVPRGSIRATVLIETIWAAFEMDEILYELREHAAGLNAGRWDYIFSVIKTFADSPESALLPDRAQVTMGVPFMRAYAQLLVKTCHRRGAHAMGGMSAFIPNRREPDVTENALAKVREDKEREASDGFDGTWVAHPDLVPVAMEIFDRALGGKPNQKERVREDVSITPEQLLDFAVPGGAITEDGLATNVSVGIRYIAAWLDGTGAAALDNLMEDAATAEISRSQVWQWLKTGNVTREQVLAAIEPWRAHDAAAAEVFEQVALSDDFVEFLTLPAYERLD
jgi:malate synthase